MIMNWDSSHDPRCSLVITRRQLSSDIPLLPDVSWRDTKHVWKDDAQFISSNIYTGFIIRSIHHIWDLSTNKFLPLTGRRPGNAWYIPSRGEGGPGWHHIPRWHLSPPCWPLHTLNILPTLEISISQWVIISQTQHCWHKLC